jgi:hypothetical protein
LGVAALPFLRAILLGVQKVVEVKLIRVLAAVLFDLNQVVHLAVGLEALQVLKAKPLSLHNAYIGSDSAEEIEAEFHVYLKLIIRFKSKFKYLLDEISNLILNV